MSNQLVVDIHYKPVDFGSCCVMLLLVVGCEDTFKDLDVHNQGTPAQLLDQELDY